jgi:hypothetical protein
LRSARLNRIGYGLFALYLVIAFLLRNHQTFFDEGSNLNLASGVLKGLHLYRDLFENHFPFAVYLTAGIIRVAGTSLPMVRLAVLLIDAAMLFAVMRVSRLTFPVGFAAAIWAFVSAYYFGSLLLYDNLAMIGGMALGVVCFAALAKGLEPSRSMFVLLAIAGFVATMSSPFFGLVTAVAVGSLFFAPQIPRMFVVKLGLAIGLPVAAYFVYLGATGGFSGFYNYAIVFNSTTYQKYTTIHILPLIGRQLLLFDLFNPDWFRSLDPLRFNPVTFSPKFDHWIFSGLFYRVAALGACGLFAWRRNYRAAVFLYLFVAMLPLREDDSFHAAPFVLFALFLAGVLIQECGLAVALGCMLPTLVLAASGARYVDQHALQSDFDRLYAEAQFIREAAQNHTDVELGHYPDGSYTYYLTGFRPLSKFVDFYPWVTEIARPEVDAELARAPKVILAMETSGSIWNYPNAGTLASEIAYAKKHLIKESFGWRTVYVSPELSMPGAAGTEAAFTALGAAVENIPVEMSGEWSKDGSGYKSTGAGTLRIGPIRLAGHSAFGIPLKSGAAMVRNAVNKKLLARVDPGHAPNVWWVWRPDLPQEPELTFEIVAESKAAGMEIGWPHWLREANPEKAYKPGLFHDGEWKLGDRKDHLGLAGDVPVTGDWNGSGRTQIGIYRPSTGEWILDNKTYHLGGQPGDIPVTGDWDGSGKTDIGIYKPATGEWLLHNRTYRFGGQAGDVPVTGDWSGSGTTRVGVVRQDHIWMLDLKGNGQDVVTFNYGGVPGDVPVVGDWNGDGRGKPGMFRRGSSWLLDFDGNYKFEDLGNDLVITLGSPGDKPVAGLW